MGAKTFDEMLDMAQLPRELTQVEKQIARWFWDAATKAAEQDMCAKIADIMLGCQLSAAGKLAAIGELIASKTVSVGSSVEVDHRSQ